MVGMPAKADPSIGYQLETIAEDLGFPWDLAFLPDGTVLLTELDGRLRIIRDGVLDPTAITGVPDVYRASQGGLFDVVPHPDFATNQLLYLSYAHGDKSANATRVVRAKFDGQALSDLEVIFDVSPTKDTPVHYGGRIAFGPDGKLFITTGDGFNYREEAQNLSNTLGVIVRLNDDGSVPSDNPFVGKDGMRPEIYSYGHRSPQGLLVTDAGAVYMSEHGPQGGDEINLIEAGNNYGWPVITYGIDYSGARITPFTQMDGMEQPLKYWVPSIAPANLELYTGDLFAAWQGDFLVAGLVPGDVRRVDMEDGAAVGEEILFAEIGERIRGIQMAPDGSLYILTDGDSGAVIRVTPN
ncbi:MAG: glucose dehydrogenase [Rhodobiaceae bacterium]|nr:MAG: glucose dehydrogenase [Rhodobiaceae bacterium]